MVPPLRRTDLQVEKVLRESETLRRLLRAAGAGRVTFDYVPGHIVAVARRPA